MAMCVNLPDTLKSLSSLSDASSPPSFSMAFLAEADSTFQSPTNTGSSQQPQQHQQQEDGKETSPKESPGSANTSPTDMDSSSRTATKRTVFSRRQVAVMEAKFIQQSFLSREERSELAERLKLTERQVMIWFQNRRGRLKRRGPNDSAYNPIKLRELNTRRPYPFLYGMISNSHYQTAPVNQSLLAMYPQDVQNTAVSAVSHRRHHSIGPYPTVRVSPPSDYASSGMGYSNREGFSRNHVDVSGSNNFQFNWNTPAASTAAPESSLPTDNIKNCVKDTSGSQETSQSSSHSPPVSPYPPNFTVTTSGNFVPTKHSNDSSGCGYALEHTELISPPCARNIHQQQQQQQQQPQQHREKQHQREQLQQQQQQQQHIQGQQQHHYHHHHQQQQQQQQHQQPQQQQQQHQQAPVTRSCHQNDTDYASKDNRYGYSDMYYGGLYWPQGYYSRDQSLTAHTDPASLRPWTYNDQSYTLPMSATGSQQYGLLANV